MKGGQTDASYPEIRCRKPKSEMKQVEFEERGYWGRKKHTRWGQDTERVKNKALLS